MHKFKEPETEVKWKLIKLNCRRGYTMLRIVENFAITQTSPKVIRIYIVGRL